MKKIAGVIAMLVLLSGCTTTPQGKSIDRSNYVDLGSTAVALASNSNVVEANPLGLALIPLKMSMGYMIEKKYGDNCADMSFMAGGLNSVFYGAAANNLLLAASASGVVAPVVGVAVGIGYYVFREDIEPSTYECIPQDGPMRSFALSYASGDVDGVVGSFAPNGVDGDDVGHEAIRKAYEDLFSTSTNRRLWFINGTRIVAEVDGLFYHYDYTVDIVDNKITILTYEGVEI